MVKVHATTYFALRVHKLAFSIEMRKGERGWAGKNGVRVAGGWRSETKRYCDAFVIGCEKIGTEQEPQENLRTKVCSGKRSDHEGSGISNEQLIGLRAVEDCNLKRSGMRQGVYVEVTSLCRVRCWSKFRIVYY